MSRRSNTMIDYDDIEFNFIEAIKYILQRCFSIVAVGIFFAIVLVASSCFTKIITTSDYTKIDIGEIDRELEQLYLKLEMYEESYQLQEQYIEQSLIMEIQPKAVYIKSIQYYIDCSLERINDLTTIFSNYSSNGGLAVDVYNKDSSVDVKFITEIMSIYCSNYGTYNDAAVLNIKVIGKDQENCEKYATHVKNAILEFSEELNVSTEPHELKLVQDMMYIGQDANIQSQQDNARATLQNYEESIMKLENSISELEDLQQNAKSNSNGLKDILVNFIIGGVIGVVISVVFYLFKYIIQSNIKYAEEVNQRTGLYCFGTCQLYDKTMTMRIFDKIRKKNNDKKECLISTRIVKECRDSNIQKLAIIGDIDKNIKEYLENIKLLLKKNDIEIQLVGDIINDIDSINALDKELPVLLAVSGKKTTYKYFNQIVEVCITKNIDIKGYIYMN